MKQDTTKYDRTLTQLLRDYGYKVEGRHILRLNPVYRTWENWRTCRGLFDACEQLIPIIADESFRLSFRNAGVPAERVVLPKMPDVVPEAKPERRVLTANERFVRALTGKRRR